MDLKDKGYALYKKGFKYQDIADKLGVSLSCVKSWATRNDWKNKDKNNVAEESKKKREEKEKKKPQKKQKVSDKVAYLQKVAEQEEKSFKLQTQVATEPRVTKQLGNKNSVNKNLKTSGYAKLVFQHFTPEQLDCLLDDYGNEKDILLQEINLLTLRESYLLERMHIMQEQQLHIQQVRTNKARGVDGEEISTTQTTAEANYMAVERLDRLISQIQLQKSRALQALTQMRLMDEKYNPYETEDATNLLEMLMKVTQGELDDISEIQPKTSYGNDVVE